MKFKTRAACHAWVKTHNDLITDLECVFIKHEGRLRRAAHGEPAIHMLEKELYQMNKLVESIVRKRFAHIREEWN